MNEPVARVPKITIDVYASIITRVVNQTVRTRSNISIEQYHYTIVCVAHEVRSTELAKRGGFTLICYCRLGSLWVVNRACWIYAFTCATLLSCSVGKIYLAALTGQPRGDVRCT